MASGEENKLSKKERTRARILDAALPLFLEHGLDAVSIDQLMAAAGLTRGGFYAHFESKEALLAELLRRDYGLPKKLRQARLGEMGPGITPADALAYYLSPNNLKEISRDCPMASQAADVRRAGGEVRNAYTDHIARLKTELLNHVHREEDAFAVMAAAVGAITIAGSIEDELLSADLLDAVNSFVQERLQASKG